MTTKNLIRHLISSYVRRFGYVANGNLIFSAASWAKIERGQWGCAVTEAGNHPANIFRAAKLLSDTYL